MSERASERADQDDDHKPRQAIEQVDENSHTRSVIAFTRSRYGIEGRSHFSIESLGLFDPRVARRRDERKGGERKGEQRMSRETKQGEARRTTSRGQFH